MQIAVEICVEPKSRADRTTVFSKRRIATTDNPTHPALFSRSLQEGITRESAPRFQLWTDAGFVTNHCDQSTRLSAAQHCDQLRQEARRESLVTYVQIDVSLHRNALFGLTTKAQRHEDTKKTTFESP
jgi:hypothetical protein